MHELLKGSIYLLSKDEIALRIHEIVPSSISSFTDGNVKILRNDSNIHNITIYNSSDIVVGLGSRPSSSSKVIEIPNNLDPLSIFNDVIRALNNYSGSLHDIEDDQETLNKKSTRFFDYEIAELSGSTLLSIRLKENITKIKDNWVIKEIGGHKFRVVINYQDNEMSRIVNENGVYHIFLNNNTEFLNVSNSIKDVKNLTKVLSQLLNYLSRHSNRSNIDIIYHSVQSHEFIDNNDPYMGYRNDVYRIDFSI